MRWLRYKKLLNLRCDKSISFPFKKTYSASVLVFFLNLKLSVFIETRFSTFSALFTTVITIMHLKKIISIHVSSGYLTPKSLILATGNSQVLRSKGFVCSNQSFLLLVSFLKGFRNVLLEGLNFFKTLGTRKASKILTIRLRGLCISLFYVFLGD